MSERTEKRSESKEKSAVTAVVKAHVMLIGLCGPRGWNDTRESWLTRGARRARLSLRRAKAIFYQEPIKLTADEYIAIQEAYDAATSAVEALQSLAGEAEVRAHRLGGEENGSREEVGGRVGQAAQRAAAGSAVRQAR